LRAWTRLGLAAFVLLLLTPLAGSIYRAAVPWERADAVGAAEYVLAHRRPSDAVIGNDWEHVYYFRRLGERFRLAFVSPFRPGCYLTRTDDGRWMLHEDEPAAESERIWIVAKSPTAEGRQEYLDQLPVDWRVVERWEFVRTTVVLVERERM